MKRESESEANRRGMQEVVASMALGKWLTGSAVVARGHVILSFTRRGRAQMGKARKAIRKIIPGSIMPPKIIDGKPHIDDISMEQGVRMHDALNEIVGELPGPLSQAGMEMLTDLLTVHGIQEEDALADTATNVKFELRSLK